MSDFTFDKKNYFGKGAEGWLLAIGITLLSIGFNSTEAVAQTDRYVSTTGVNAGDCSDPMNPCLTIQYAISQSLAGDNVHVGAGTYNENLSVDRSLSFFGGGMANVIGSDVSPGTFHILPAINNVLIDGFIIVGFDSPNPAIERAAIYLQGNHTNITIQNNTVTAAGEAGYLEEFGAMNVNVTISNNIFNGQTFVGPMPAGCGFSMQFTLHNVPRQLVVVSNNSSNVIFTNNIISGTTGGPSTEPGCTVTGQGNNLVTIDATNVTISGNTFNGTMYGSSSMLRARGTQVSVSGNTFDGSNLNGSTYYIFFDNDALAGGTPSTVAGVVGANTFLPAAAHVTSGTNFLVISCTGPILNTSINGFVSNETGNDGINDTVSYSVCNVPLNILFNSFTDVFSPALPNVRVYQIRETSNLTVPFCNNCSAVPSAFTGATGTAALINPALPGTLTFKFFAFSDANGNTTYETSECRGDTVVYIITVNPIPQLTAQTPSICPSQNPFNLTSLQSSITSATGTFTYSIGGSPIMNPAAFNANNGDVVNVTFTDANGCTNTTTITFTLLNAPPVSILPFAGNPFTQVCVGREARFLASATAAGPPAVQSYMWTFSGSPVLNNYGQTAVDGTRRNRGAIYNNAAIGPQTVNLTVIYTNGCSVTAPQHTINVLPLPVLTAQTPAICINENPFDLTSLEASITSATGTFSYSFGGSPVADPTMFTAANGDVVDVNFTDSNGCSNTTTITFTVNPLPVLTAQTPSICPSENPFDLTSLESSITSATGSFAYEFGGNPVMDPTAFTAADGNVVNVTFTDGNGCSSTTTITFTLLDAPAVTILPFMGNPFTQVCVGVEARFLASATAAGPPAVQSYMWTFSGSPVLNNYGQTAVDGTRRNRGAIYNNAAVGPQTVNLTVIYTNGCSVTAPQHTINVLPLPVLTAQTPAICINENPFDLTSLEASITSATGTFSYSFGGSPVADPTMFTAANGDVVDVNFTDGNGCSNTTTITFTVNPLPVLTAQTPSICPSDNPFDLTSLESSITSATGTFAYEFGGNPVMDPTAFTAADGNVVNVTFTDGNGCSSTTTITFTLLPEPPVTILPFMGNPFTRVCVGVEARFLASPTAAGPPAVQSYMWTFSGSPTLGNYGQTAGDGTRRNRGAIYNNAAVGPQTVNLTVIYANGCTSTAPTHTIIVNPLPIVTCPADTIVCEDAGNIDLTTLVPAASPAGGTFAGTYVISGNLFNTSSAGVGTHAVRYRYTDINGCVDSCAFNIIVYDIPSAPQLNKVPNVTFACTGDILSAVVLTPGTGGSGSCEDQYRFSTDNGMTWSSWSTTIPSFSAVTGVNIIEARRFCNTNRCPSDITSISWNVNAPITAVNISVVPAGDVCLGATGVQYTANVTGGTGPFTYAWCAYNSGDGSGTCFGGFSPGGSNPIQTRNWTATTGPKSVGVTVSQEGCPNATALYSFNVVGDPVRPSLATASPTTSYACRGANVSATFNAGTGGTGSCTDEYRFSTDNGATWSAYVPGSMITMGAQTVLIQTRRVCDGLGCDGAGEVFATVVSWTSSALPTPSIVPDPAEVCAGVDLQLDGNPSGGTGTYDTHLWTGPGAAFVEPDNEQVTVFNTSAAGVYDLTYTVTDNNGCIGTDAIQITVFPLPTVTCPADTIVCEDADRIDLTTLVPAANPAGGTFIGLNVSGGFFDVDGAGVGSYEIIYEYEDINGCTNTCTFNITVFDIPSAPQLNKVPNVTFACTGDLLSAVVITPGTGGSGSCEDQYRFSTDNGMTWSSWSATIPSFSAVAGVNIIEARRFCNTNRCPSDITSISWNVNAPITAVNISVAPTGDVCLGATGVQYTANVTGGTGPFTYAWCAYDSGDGSGTCFGGFSPGGSNPIQTRNWVATTGPKSVGVTVSQEGCPNATALYSFNVVADPVRPSLATASPTTSYACRGANVSATFNAGTGGTGSCTDEYRFSTDNGATWSAYVPGSMITMGTQTVLIQTRRVCDGPGCDGAGEEFETVVSWTSSALPTASIVPDPAEVCAGVDLQLDGNPSGGTGTYDTHLWTGPGAAFVEPDNEQVTVFNNTSSGTYTVIYIVTDSNGCTGTDEITVLVNENPVADILPATVSEFICPGKNLLLNGNPSGGDGNYTHQWEDAENFNDPNIQSPVFNSLILGEYTVTYTVTDGNGCTATDAITFTVGDEVAPEITCPADVTLATDPDVCTALHTFTVDFSDNCAGLDIVGFENEFAPSNWTLTNSTLIGNGTVDESLAPSSITITGSDFGPVSGPSNNTDYCVTIPGTTAGMLTFDWSYTSLDGDGPFWDKFGYVVDGVFTQVSNDAGPVNQMGSETISLTPGQEFCFRILSIDQGFGAAVTITMNFGYMENINPMLSQTEGLPSGSDFPLGTTINTFVVTDFAGNTNSCSFSVTVEDRQNPVAICPDDIDITLDPLECGRVLEFAADGSDNCSIDDIRQTEGLLSGSFFPIGKDTITFVVEDGSGNTASCSFTVTVRDFPHPPLGCIPVHLSLDEECTAELTALNVLTGYLGPEGEILLGCLDCFIIDVKAPNGTSLGNTVDGTYLGKTLNYTIVNTKSGFSCWNTVLIEDKIKPTIECRNDTISCMAPISTAKTPIVRDNCGAKAVQVDERFERLECDEIAIGRYIRTWKAVDNYGNESMTCSDTVYLRRTNLEGLEFPGDMTLSCSSGYATDSKGFPYPAPSVGGVPTLNGVNLYPFNNSLICNGTVHYNDHLFLNTACKKMILRTWTITEWWCSTTVTYNMPPQIFTIIDDKAPVIPVVADITVTTKSRACDADVILPALNITDDCNDLKTVYINATLNGTPSGFLGSNGGTLQLTAGVHTVEYTAFDICGNSSTMSFTVTVRDLTPPIAICDHLNTVSLNNQGYAKATALAIDNGSFDECGPVDLKIQRMEDPCGNGFNVGWHDEVEFCCEDAGKTRMVTLLVTDAGGNTNMCMVSVQVQDKIPPAMSCPANITVEDCTFTFDPTNAGVVFGNPEIFDNCPSNNTIREVLVDSRNNCGIGVVTRTFTLVSGGQSYGTCVQTIEFRNLEPFDAYNPAHLIWPRDTMLNSICSPLNLLPESLGDLHGFPRIIEDACDLVGMNYEDQIFYFANNNACFKILRTWSIIDWCQKNTDGTYKVWTWEQEIKVVDNTAPVITSSTESRMVCTYDSECQSGVISGLIATATDCTPDSMLQWSYKVYDTDVNPHVLYASGIGNDVSGTYPVGKYRVDFTVLDRCGNIATTSYNFEIRNCKAPTAICKVGLATSLTMMDTNNDGTGDTPLAMIRPEFFNNKSYHPCNYDLKFSFSANVNDTLRTFTCDSVGMRNIQMWVTDVNGNTSFCTTFISVQDSMNLCTGNRIAVSGTVKTEEQQEVAEVMVYLNNGEGGQTMTNDEGKYIFEELQTGGTYAFRPEKKGDDKNGVTTLDIVMIQRHILGMQPLSSPYKLLAADVNKSGNISSADLLEIRKLILGLYDQLPVVDSWKFVDRNYQFPDPSAPWLGVLPEECIVPNIYQNTAVNFVAVKMGDVNGSAKGNYNGTPLEHRSTYRFWMEEGTVTQDNVRRIPVRAGNDQTLYGMQMMLHFRDIEYANIVPAGIRIAAQEMVKFGTERIGLSISIPEGIRVREDDVLFYIEVKSGVSQDVKHLISIGTEVNPEVYTDGMYEQQLTMQWRNVDSDPFEVLNVQPNPWKDHTFIHLTMPESAMVSFKVKDLAGRKVLSRVEQLQKGLNQIMVTSSELMKAGVYIFEVKYANQSITGKMIMVE